MNIPLVDLKAQYESIKGEVDEAINRVIQNSHFILGPELEAFEKAMASYLKVKYAIGVASGTDALHLALLACGIGPGDEVITTPFTFIATAETIAKCGAKPLFVDIEPTTCNIDPEKIAALLTNRDKDISKIKAILPVNLYGHVADMKPIMKLAQQYGLKVIEDSAQSLGALYCKHLSSSSSSSLRAEVEAISKNEADWQQSGTMGDAGCLSFFPSKVLGAYGDGGMVVTNDENIAEKITMLRNHGCKQKYYHLIPGFNSRLDGLQAAILSVKLAHLDEWLNQRRQKASLYARLLASVEGIETPLEAPYCRHCFNYYTVRLKKPEIDRNRLRGYLTSQGIATAVYYPLSLHFQQIFLHLGYQKGDFPASEQAQEEVLSLPMYPEMAAGQITKIAQAVNDGFKNKS
jgi:dTDP-4-amino-4,6-dideoxygalactose transaminase